MKLTKSQQTMTFKSKTFLLPENLTVILTGTKCQHFSKQPILQKARSVLASRRIKEGSRKAREHVGNMDNYSFDRDRKLPRVPRVVWRYLALKFHVRIKKWSHSPKRWSFYRHLLVKMVWTQTSLTNVKGLVV